MKKIYLFTALVLIALNANAQITGTWRLAPNTGALAVGPAQGDYSWWSNSMADVATRSCLFDDSITFDAGGGMSHYMDGNTWVELWQGASTDGCGTPVAPHDGTTNAPYTYSYNSTTGELTVNGVGAHLGLAKVTNIGEITSPDSAVSSITYLVSFSSDTDTMNVDINFGPGWWHYTYVKTSAWSMPNPNVTFRVNMSNYTGTITTGVYVSGSFNGWCGNCNPLANSGNGVWQATIPIPAGNIEYKFTIDDWNDQEQFIGTESCIDPVQDPYFNRYLQFTSDVTLPAVCFNSCDLCPTISNPLIGTWRLAPNSGALAVGPAQGDYSWWSNSMADVATRSCLFDDSITFDAGGGMSHYMDGNTWVELWQGASADGCGTPVAPHDGTTNAPFSYIYDSATGELTINGIGAHLGLAKVTNIGEITSPDSAASSITYLVSFSSDNDTMNVDINFGPGWWHYTYVKSTVWSMANPNVTFRVNMSNYTGTIGTGVYVNGTFNGWCGNCNPLIDQGNGIWQTTLPIPAGSIEYLFTIDGWMDQESFTGTESCIDPNNDTNYNRYLQFISDITLPAVCFNSCDPCLTVSPELVGTWKLKPEAGSLTVGPSQGNGSWWSNSIADVATRSCLFDDSIKFEANGAMTHFMDGSTWLEAWQGATPDSCGSPVAPHDGTTNAPYTYSYNSATGELTTLGVGAHIGLSKVYNGGELTNPANAPTSITYQVTLSNNNNTLTADINFGIGWWRFIYERAQPIVVADPNITFKVDMSTYTGTIANGVYLNGSFNSWCGTCNPMTNAGNGIWEVTLPLSEGPIQYKYTIDGWNAQEEFLGGESCVDTINDGFFNRYFVVTADAMLPVVCFGSCVACATGSLIENEMAISISPNPTNEQFKVTSEFVINQVELIDILGKQVKVVTANSKSLSINVHDLNKGVYTMVVYSNNGKTTNRVIVE